MCGMAAFQPVFMIATPQHRCKIPMLDNDTYKITSHTQKRLVDLYIPYDNDTNNYDSCHIINNELNDDINSTTRKCDEWVYSTEFYETSAVTEWNLVCDNTSEKSLYKSLYFFGSFGVFLMGVLADRFGRKKVIHIFLILNAVFVVVLSLSLNFLSDDYIQRLIFGFSRFAIGVTSNFYGLACVLLVELVGPSYRVTATNTMNYFYILGEFIILIFGYFVRDFKIFSIYLAGIYY